MIAGVCLGLPRYAAAVRRQFLRALGAARARPAFYLHLRAFPAVAFGGPWS
jgi:hypothetical protein